MQKGRKQKGPVQTHVAFEEAPLTTGPLRVSGRAGEEELLAAMIHIPSARTSRPRAHLLTRL